jgi:hypothetical protein
MAVAPSQQTRWNAQTGLFENVMTGAGVVSSGISGAGAIGAGAMNYGAYFPNPVFIDPIEQLIYNVLTTPRAGGAFDLAKQIREQIDMFNLAAAWGLSLQRPAQKVELK